jgi:hypothetical protein
VDGQIIHKFRWLIFIGNMARLTNIRRNNLRGMVRVRLSVNQQNYMKFLKTMHFLFLSSLPFLSFSLPVPFILPLVSTTATSRSISMSSPPMPATHPSCPLHRSFVCPHRPSRPLRRSRRATSPGHPTRVATATTSPSRHWPVSLKKKVINVF